MLPVLFSRRRLLVALLLSLAGALAAPSPAAAQEVPEIAVSDSLQEIRLSDGSVIFGRVLDVRGETVVVELQAGGRLEVPRGQIVTVTPVRGRVVEGAVWTEDPHATRLFFGPTARAAGNGHAYLGVYEVFFPFVSVGFGNHVTLSGGTPIIPGVIGEIWYLAPKVTVLTTPRASAAVGALYGTDGDAGAGIFYAVGTFGDPDGAVTTGVGWGFSDEDTYSKAIIMLGGELRAGRYTKLITENYFATGGGDGIISGGVRFFTGRLSADLGMATVVGTDCGSECYLPLVNFVYSFGGR